MVLCVTQVLMIRLPIVQTAYSVSASDATFSLSPFTVVYLYPDHCGACELVDAAQNTVAKSVARNDADIYCGDAHGLSRHDVGASYKTGYDVLRSDTNDHEWTISLLLYAIQQPFIRWAMMLLFPIE